MSEPTDSNNGIVQIKVKLLGVSKPPVWRRLQLDAATRLDHLHEVLVAAFGWDDYCQGSPGFPSCAHGDSPLGS